MCISHLHIIPFIVSLSMTALPHRKPASARTSYKTCCDHTTKSYSAVSVIILKEHKFLDLSFRNFLHPCNFPSLLVTTTLLTTPPQRSQYLLIKNMGEK